MIDLTIEESDNLKRIISEAIVQSLKTQGYVKTGTFSILDIATDVAHALPKPVSYCEEKGNCPLCKREITGKYHKSWRLSMDCKGCGFRDEVGILGNPSYSCEYSVTEVNKNNSK